VRREHTVELARSSSTSCQMSTSTREYRLNKVLIRTKTKLCAHSGPTDPLLSTLHRDMVQWPRKSKSSLFSCAVFEAARAQVGNTWWRWRRSSSTPSSTESTDLKPKQDAPYVLVEQLTRATSFNIRRGHQRFPVATTSQRWRQRRPQLCWVTTRTLRL
jgi:hypothetical protein